MKKILLILAVLLSQYSYSQMMGSHSYAKGDCTTLENYVGSDYQRLGISINNTGGSKIIKAGLILAPYWSTYELTMASASLTDSYIFNTAECKTGYENFTIAFGDGRRYRAFQITPYDTVYGEVRTVFGKSGTLKPPTLELNSITDITSVSATANYGVTSDGGSSITHRGVCYGLYPYPTTDSTKTDDGTGSGYYQSFLISLQSSKTYYARSYAINSTGTGYSDQLSFTTATSGSTVPVVITSPITNITDNTATSGGVIIYTGGATITSKGICYKIGATPISSDNTIYSGSGSESFVVNMTGLAQNTEYHVRAWARNSYVINGFTVSVLGYGQEEIFTTLPTNVIFPTLTTTGAHSITTTSAYSGGSIVSVGTSPITDWGVCYSTMTNPTIANSFVSSGVGQSGSFTTALSGLNYSTKYYVRAYATTADGTAYGNQIEFTTLSPSGIPTISTIAVTNITATSATSGGNYIADNGATIDLKGLQWSLYSDFSVLAGSTDSGTGTSSFVSSITSVSCGSVYYVRAYAHNSVGYGYGNILILSPTLYPYTFKTWISSITDDSNTVHNGTDLSSAQTICSIQNSHNYKSSIVGAKAFSSYSVGGLMYESVASSWCYSSFTGYLVFYSLSNYSDIVYLLSGVIQSINPCTEICPSVGDSYGGGIVAYVFQSGDPGYVSGECHGIIAATSDQGTAAYFGCYGSNLSGASSILLEGGEQNTIDIIAGCSDSGTSARLCYDYSSGSYSDWWLPSLNELLKLYANRSLIGGFNTSAVYSTSSEVDAYSVYSVNFVDGSYSVGSNTKLYPFYVRAIRYF